MQRIVAIYDHITEAIRGLIGKQDIIKQFYAQMETGKFRNTQQQVPGGDGRVRTMSLDSDASERALRSFNSVKRGKQVKSIVGQLSENGARKVAAALQSTDFNQNARLVIDKNAVNHLRNSGHLTGMGRNGADANPLTEADIRALPHVFSDPDVVYMSGTGRTGKRMVFERQLDNHHRIVAELEYSGKDFNLVTYFNINKDLPNDKPAMSYSPEGVVAADESGRQPSRPERSSGDPDNGFNGSVANSTQNVNTDPRYKLDQSQNPSEPFDIKQSNNYKWLTKPNGEYFRISSKLSDELHALREASYYRDGLRRHPSEKLQKLFNKNGLEFNYDGDGWWTGKFVNFSENNQSKPSAIDNLNNAMDKYRADKQRRQQPLQETINNIQDNPKPKMTKELRQAIDNFIFENELFMFITSDPVIISVKVRRISRFAAAHMAIASSTRFFAATKM